MLGCSRPAPRLALSPTPAPDASQEAPDLDPLGEDALRLQQPLPPIEPYPFLAEITRSLGVDLPGRAVEDPRGCASCGVEAFTEGLVTHFADPRPPLEVASHEAAHLLQHAGRTGDGGLGPEAHAQQISAAVADGGGGGLLTAEGPVHGTLHPHTPAPSSAPAPAPDGGAPAPATAPSGDEAPGLTPDAAKRLLYAKSVLSGTPPMTPEQSATLRTAIPASELMETLAHRDDLRTQLEQANIDLQSAGDISGPEKADAQRSAASRVGTLTVDLERYQTLIDAELRKLGIADEAALVDLVKEQFPKLWEARAMAIANAMLDQNLALVDAQDQRYRGSERGGREAESAEASIDDLRRSDQELAGLATKLAQSYGGGGGPTPTSSYEGLKAEREAGAFDGSEAVAAAKLELLTRWEALGQAHPLLFSPEYRPGYLASVGDEALLEQTGGYAQKVRDNIAETRENLGEELSLLDLEEVPQLTWQALGVDPTGVLGEAVAEKYAEVKSNEEALRAALDALVIGATLIGSICGGPLGAMIAGGAVGGLVGVASLAVDIRKYSAVSAAQRVSVDPDFARMTTEEPDLVPIVTDLVMLGVVMADAVAVARTVRTLIRQFRLDADAAMLRDGLRRALGHEEQAARYAERIENQSHIAPGGGLAAHDRVGPLRTSNNAVSRLSHPLDHVGKTEAQLQQRLAAEPNLRRASTFDSREAAERLIGGVLDHDEGVIRAWLKAAADGDRMTCTMTGLTGTGTVLERGAASSVQGTGLQVIIEKLPNHAGLDYTVVTAYPTP